MYRNVKNVRLDRWTFSGQDRGLAEALALYLTFQNWRG